jgi:hypothetical protein
MQSGHWKEQVFSSVYPSLLRPVERFDNSYGLPASLINCQNWLPPLIVKNIKSYSELNPKQKKEAI